MDTLLSASAHRSVEKLGIDSMLSGPGGGAGELYVESQERGGNMVERRWIERRGPTRIHWPERRTAFDRRGRSHPLLNPAILLAVLLLLNLLSVLDWALTRHELSFGVHEANPLMAFLFQYGDGIAIAVKVVIMLLVSLAVWRLRRFRRILDFAVTTTVAYAGLLVYHVTGIALTL